MVKVVMVLDVIINKKACIFTAFTRGRLRDAWPKMVIE